jgi:transposase-like protein
MKNNNIDKEILKYAIEEFILDYKLDEYCPFCDSDDFDVINSSTKRCYNCNMDIPLEKIKEYIVQKFFMKLDRQSFKKFKKGFEVLK